jgi:putative transposase
MDKAPPDELILAHKIALDPTPAQRQYLARACGVARFAWNWGLARWNEIYEQGGRPNWMALRGEFLDSVKGEPEYSWIGEVTHWAVQGAFRDLGTAFTNYFRNLRNGTLKPRNAGKPRKDDKRPGHPRFKERGIHDSFYMPRQSFRLHGRRVRIPMARGLDKAVRDRLCCVKMREELRFAGDVISARISRRANRWFIAVQVRLDEPPYSSQGKGLVGIALAATSAATLSTGQAYHSPKPLKAASKRVRKANKELARRTLKRCGKCGLAYRDLQWRQAGHACPGCGTKAAPQVLPAKEQSANWHKTSRRVARIHARVADVRHDFLHRTTTEIVKRNRTVVLGNLDVSEMLKDHRLARHISDIGIYEFRRQVEYKGSFAGTEVIVADRWFASSQICSRCGYRREGEEKLQLRDKMFTCPKCGFVQNRYLNGALNLAHHGQATLKTRGCNACGDDSAGRGA